MSDRRVNRFWSKVKRGDQSGCWVWLFSCNPRGYGLFRNLEAGRFRTRLAHRVAWTIARGPIPEGFLVLHRCDNPPCVNLSHLFLGTQSDNIRDCYSKGRGRDSRGERSGKAKLTERLVREIRASEEGHRAMARRLGVSLGAIQAVIKRRSWKHVS